MRERGGDPDLGHQVPALLSAAGFEVMAANATLECTSANDFQWSAGAPVILLSAAKRGAAHTDGERQARVLRDLDALRTEGWLYFGI